MQPEHLGAMIQASCRRGGERSAMLHQRDGAWQPISYRQLGETVRRLARAFADRGLGPGDAVGIISPNRPEWAIADFAAQTVQAVTVPIYTTSSARQITYILDDADVKLLLVGDAALLELVLAAVAAARRRPALVLCDRCDATATSGAASLDQVLAAVAAPFTEAEVEARLAAASLDDVATVIYTSGTTGEPKGAMLTHRNFAHQATSLDVGFSVGPGDRSLCFLPLSHVYERSWSYYVFRVGAENAYLADPRQVIAAMQELQPTVMVSVPRLYEKIHATACDRVEHASPLRRALFRWALAIGWAANSRRAAGVPLGPWLALRHRVADRLVLAKIRAIVGGSKNFFSAGGAPLAREIEEFFFSAGLLVCEGYGLTETSPMISYNAPGAFRFGTVGRPIPGCELRIATDGEVQVRGPNVMQGYLNKPEATAEAFVDGWFRTGDVGELDGDGFLRITGRIKDLIITSGGKNIAPQAIETAIGKDHFIEQVAVVGDRRKYVAALVVPAFATLEEWARRHGIAWSSRAELVAHPEVVAFYRHRIDAQSSELAAFEQVKRFTLLPAELTQAGGELTPTLKIRRAVVADTYRAEIEAMFVD